MLAEKLDDIDDVLLNQVCIEQWDESSTLEFKAVLPKPAPPDDKPKQEFLKDVASLANAGGGDIVYGISEVDGKASALVPIREASDPIDATRRRLGQWLESGVEPRIGGVEMLPIQLAAGGYVLVIRVPASFQRPHRSRIGAQWQWPVRSGTHTADLTYSQLRDEFDRGATLGARARRFRDERLTAVVSGTTGRPLKAGPRCVVHFLPMASIAGGATIDLKQMSRSASTQFFSTWWGSATSSFNLDGVVVYPSNDAADTGYRQIFRMGCVEAAQSVASMMHGKAINSHRVADHVRESIQQSIDAAKSWGINGPAIAGVALLDVHGWPFVYDSRDYNAALSSADRPNLILPETWIQDLASAQLDAIVRPLLDTLWQAFNISGCGFYDKNGVWLRRPA